MMLKDAQCLFMTFENSNDNSLHFLKPEFGCQNEKTAGRKEKKKKKSPTSTRGSPAPIL